MSRMTRFAVKYLEAWPKTQVLFGVILIIHFLASVR